MTERRCPVPGCHNSLGATRQGDPWLMCRRHYMKLDNPHRIRLWQIYKAWQRLERQRLRRRNDPEGVPPALINAIAEAMSEYLDIRKNCIQAVRDPDTQLELAQ